MPFSIQQSPASNAVKAAWQARQGRCDSWHLLLDKLSFQNAAADRESPKHNALLKIRETYSAPNMKAELALAAERQQRFLASLALQHGTRFHRVTLVNSSRLLLHLGRANVLENVGLYCDRTTGLPVIPGSAVKGVLSTWACWEGNENRDEFTTARSLLGSSLAEVFGANPADDAAASDCAGNVVFLGGFPQSVPGLELDIVTPHPLEGRGRITPSPFLAIKADCKWDFVLLVSSRIPKEKVAAMLQITEEWLKDCLTQVGLGAKTAAGYGNFRALTDDETKSDTKRFDELLAALRNGLAAEEMTPEDRAYHDFVGGVRDWAAGSRDVLTGDDISKSRILRFFRSDDGKEIIKSWPKNDKAKARLAALKEAGL